MSSYLKEYENKTAFVLRSGSDKLLKKQIKILQKYNIPIIPLKNTTAHGYLLALLNIKKYEWLISIDEDAFICDWNGIYELIKFMEDNNYVLSGTPDGGMCKMRFLYPHIINGFFNIYHMKKINVPNEKIKEINDLNESWDKISIQKRFEICDNFKNKVKDTFPYKIKNEINCKGTEPTYLFFIYLQENYKYYLFYCEDDIIDGYSSLPATKIFTPITKKPFLIHTWLARNYKRAKGKKRINAYYNKCSKLRSNK